VVAGATNPKVAMVSDSKYIYVVRDGKVSKLQKSDYSVLAFVNLSDPRDAAQLPVPAGNLYDPIRLIPKFDVEKVDALEAFRRLFSRKGGMYQVGSGVHGKVTLHLKNITTRQAVIAVAAQVGATVRMDNGVAMIEPAERRIKMGSDSRIFYQVESMPEPPSPTMELDGDNLNIAIGTMLCTLRKSDLKVISRGQLP